MRWARAPLRSAPYPQGEDGQGPCRDLVLFALLQRRSFRPKGERQTDGDGTKAPEERNPLYTYRICAGMNVSRVASPGAKLKNKGSRASRGDQRIKRDQRRERSWIQRDGQWFKRIRRVANCEDPQ